jgi:hypothetical protein
MRGIHRVVRCVRCCLVVLKQAQWPSGARRATHQRPPVLVGWSGIRTPPLTCADYPRCACMCVSLESLCSSALLLCSAVPARFKPANAGLIKGNRETAGLEARAGLPLTQGGEEYECVALHPSSCSWPAPGWAPACAPFLSLSPSPCLLALLLRPKAAATQGRGGKRNHASSDGPAVFLIHCAVPLFVLLSCICLFQSVAFLAGAAVPASRRVSGPAGWWRIVGLGSVNPKHGDEGLFAR